MIAVFLLYPKFKTKIITAYNRIQKNALQYDFNCYYSQIGNEIM